MVAMDLRHKISLSVITIISIFVIGFLVGAAILTGYFEFSSHGSVPDQISAPTWENGKYWTYSFKTPEIEDVISRIVVASNDGTDYQVGVASRIDAQRHAVLNYNPMLGRIAMDDLSIYEKGVPQPLFRFPLKENIKWSFSMFGVEEFFAEVKTIKAVDLPKEGETVLVEIEAEAPSGERLTYSYDTKAQWIRSLVLEDNFEEPLLEMNLVSYDRGFAGDVYFVRAVDLFDEEYNAPAVDAYNTFIDQGHPNWGPFDSLVYYLEVLTGDSSGGTVIIKDPILQSQSTKKIFGPNTFENTIGTIPSESGEWSVSVTLAGESYLRLRIAGGIEYTWAVE